MCDEKYFWAGDHNPLCSWDQHNLICLLIELDSQLSLKILGLLADQCVCLEAEKEKKVSKIILSSELEELFACQSSKLLNFFSRLAWFCFLFHMEMATCG